MKNKRFGKPHPSLNMKPMILHETASPSEEEESPIVIQASKKHVKLFQMGLCVVLLLVFVGAGAVIGIVSGFNSIKEPANTLSTSLKSGKLNKAITEAHLALHSIRTLSDSIPMDDIIKHWGHTNSLLESSEIPWKELPQWRLFAQNAFKITADMLKKHPNWAKDIERSTMNLKATAQPLTNESKVWRKSLRGASAAYAKTLMSMYKDYLEDDDTDEKV